MGRYLLRRAVQVPIILLVLVTISFFLMRAAPGGPFQMEKQVDPEIKKKMEEKYRLDEPRLAQYTHFLRDLWPWHVWTGALAVRSAGPVDASWRGAKLSFELVEQPSPRDGVTPPARRWTPSVTLGPDATTAETVAAALNADALFGAELVARADERGHLRVVTRSRRACGHWGQVTLTAASTLDARDAGFGPGGAQGDDELDVRPGFDLGASFKNKAYTVNEVIAAKAPVSALLGIVAMLIALLLGLGAGVVAGVRQNSVFDYGSMTVAMIGLALPTFVVGPLLALTFGLWWKVLPVAGYAEEGGFLGGLLEPRFLILPSIALALPFAARIARLTRAGMLEVVHQDYIRTAHAKGLREQVVVLRHALRGALLPVVSFLGPAVAQILTGSLVVEQIFAIPGIGREFVTSATNRDYTMVMGTVILFGVLLVVFNLLVDIIYGFLDPRIRYT